LGYEEIVKSSIRVSTPRCKLCYGAVYTTRIVYDSTEIIICNKLKNIQKDIMLRIKTNVMHVKFTHGFMLDGNLNILLLSYPGRDRSVTAAAISITCQFITLSLRLNPAVT